MSTSEHAGLARRPRIGPGQPVGVTEDMISEVVDTFYARVRRDEVLGPLFKGRPMAAHAAVPDIEPRHFERWLSLFGDTVAELCPPDAAALFREKAAMIGESLQLGIAVSRGELPPLSRGA